MTTSTHDQPESGSKADEIAVKGDYLPATAPFHDRFPAATPAETVRQAAMTFFGVKDYQDRDTHVFRMQVGGTVRTPKGSAQSGSESASCG